MCMHGIGGGMAANSPRNITRCWSFESFEHVRAARGRWFVAESGLLCCEMKRVENGMGRTQSKPSGQSTSVSGIARAGQHGRVHVRQQQLSV